MTCRATQLLKAVSFLASGDVDYCGQQIRWQISSTFFIQKANVDFQIESFRAKKVRDVND